MNKVIRFVVVVAAAVGLNVGVATSNEVAKRWTRCTIEGTASGETIHGTAGRDVICAGAGDDTISGRGGRDTVLAGRGDDMISGGRGNDVLIGGSGWDHLIGREGIDDFSGFAGTDCFAAKDGFSEVVRGGKGSDYARVDMGTPDGTAPDDVRSIENQGRTCPIRPVA
jgi:Ca2+-binding RTX toxin-like protein